MSVILFFALCFLAVEGYYWMLGALEYSKPSHRLVFIFISLLHLVACFACLCVLSGRVVLW